MDSFIGAVIALMIGLGVYFVFSHIPILNFFSLPLGLLSFFGAGTYFMSKHY